MLFTPGTSVYPEAAGSVLPDNKHRFDVVAIGITDEASVIVFRIMWPRTGRAVVLGASVERGCVKCLYLPGVFCPKGDMHVRQGAVALVLGDFKQASFADVEGPKDAFFPKRNLVAERNESSFIEVPTAFQVANTNCYVVDNGPRSV